MQRISVADAVSVVRQVVREAREDRITFLAAAVAYYGFVSIVPLLLLVVAVGTAVAGTEVTAAALTLVGGFLTSSGETVVRDALTDASGRTPATLVGILLLAWSGTRLFRGLDAAFSAVYGIPARDSIVRQVLDAGLVLGVVGIAVAAAVSLGIVFPTIEAIPFAGSLSTLSLLASLAVVFFPVFYVFPDSDISVREALPGTLFAATGWTVLAGAFRLYTGYVNDFRLYGILGAAVLLVTFLYLGATIIMLGAVVNAVLVGRTETESDAREEASRPDAAPDITGLAHEVNALRLELDEKTVSRADLEAELKQYVRSRLRRGQARGWGPYLVLLYGTVMTVGAFVYLDGAWAIGAMLVVWLSTLGLYALMLIIGVGINVAGVPGALLDRVRSLRS